MRALLHWRVLLALTSLLLTIAVSLGGHKNEFKKIGENVKEALNLIDPAFVLDRFGEETGQFQVNWPVRFQECTAYPSRLGSLDSASCTVQWWAAYPLRPVVAFARSISAVWSLSWPAQALLLFSHCLALIVAFAFLRDERRKERSKRPSILAMIFGSVLLAVLAGILIALVLKYLLLGLTIAFSAAIGVILWINIGIWLFVEAIVHLWHIFKEMKEVKKVLRETQHKALGSHRSSGSVGVAETPTDSPRP
jgi:hypothetical protein